MSLVQLLGGIPSMSRIASAEAIQGARVNRVFMPFVPATGRM